MIKQEYFGKYKSKWNNSDFNKYFVTGLIQGEPHDSAKRLIRVVQIRLEAGDFGSDIVLGRTTTDLLITHANQCFYEVPIEFKSELDDLFKDIYLDEPNEEYTIGKKDPEIGFIIPSKIKEGESTPMRDIKNALCVKIYETLESQGRHP